MLEQEKFTPEQIAAMEALDQKVLPIFSDVAQRRNPQRAVVKGYTTSKAGLTAIPHLRWSDQDHRTKKVIEAIGLNNGNIVILGSAYTSDKKRGRQGVIETTRIFQEERTCEPDLAQLTRAVEEEYDL